MDTKLKSKMVRPANPVARTFRELNAYQRARQASNGIFKLTETFPQAERFALTDQMRRSSRAPKSMIASAWARRRYKAAFISKLDEALEEAVETQSWLDDAQDRNYITARQYRELDAEWESIGALIQGMINRADPFCRLAPDPDHSKL
jgi:four helix bundle protein